MTDSSYLRVTRRKLNDRFYKLLIIPFLLELSLLLVASILEMLSSSFSAIETVIQLALAFSILYVMLMLVVIATSFARFHAARDYHHGSIYRVSATVDEQLDFRRRAIAEQEDNWFFILAFLSQSVLLTLLNLLVLSFLNWITLVVTFLFIGGMIIVLIWKVMRYRQRMTADSNEESVISIRKTTIIRVLPDPSTITFSSIRVTKLVILYITNATAYILMFMLVDYLGIDIPGVHAIRSPFQGVPLSLSIVSFVLVMILSLPSIIMILSLPSIVTCLLYDLGMRKVNFLPLSFKTLKDVIIRSLLIMMILYILAILIQFIVTFPTFSTVDNQLALFLEGQLLWSVFMIIQGFSLGVLWWYDVTTEYGPTMGMRDRQQF